MPAVFPATLPDFNEPSAPITTPLGLAGDGTRPHLEHHRDLGDELRAVAAKVGVDGSADVASLDYKVAALNSGLAGHLADPIDAHDASAISFVPTGTIASTDVQAAIAEVASEAGASGISPTLFDANTILKADVDDTPVALPVAATTLVGRKATGGIAALTATEVRGFLNMDVSDVANALDYRLFDANTILKADVDNTPLALTVGTGTVVGRDAGSIATIPWSAAGAASSLLRTDANADVTLATSAFATGAITGGKIKSASSVVFNSKNTLTSDPTDSAIGSPIIIDFDNILSNASGQQATGFFGPRGAHSIEGRVSYSVNATTWQLAPLGYTDQLIVRNTPTQARTIVPSWQYMDARIWAAEGAAVTAQKSDVNPFGPVAFTDNQTFITTAAGSWITSGAGQGTDYTLASFVSMPVVSGNTALSRRVGLQILDVGRGGSAFATAVNGGGLRAKLSADLDATLGTITEQYGVLIPRLVNATTNVGILNNSKHVLWNDTVTFTADPDNAIEMTGTFTLNYLNAIISSAYQWAPTVKWKNTGSGFGASSGFQTSPILQNDATFTGDLGAHAMFTSNPTLRGDTVATTAGQLRALNSSPTISKVGTGTLALTTESAVSSDLTVNAGATVTDRKALLVSDATGAGTLTNQYGLFVGRMTKGATLNLGIRSDTPMRFWADTATLSALGNPIVETNGVFTLDFANAQMPELWKFSGTIKYKQAGNGFGSLFMFRHAGTITNDTSFTGALGPQQVFVASPTITGDTNATTMSTHTAFYSQPVVNRVNAGTMTVTDVIGCDMTLAVVGAGATVTTFTGYKVSNPGNPAGTLTNVIGVDIASLTRGATLNLGIRNAAPTVFTPPAAQSITAAGTAIGPVTSTYYKFTTNAAITSTAAPTIADGQADGQIVILCNVGSTAANTLTVQDQGTLASSNLRLQAPTRTLGNRDILALMWSADVGDWVELFYSNVT